jgi:hypothetical protein
MNYTSAVVGQNLKNKNKTIAPVKYENNNKLKEGRSFTDKSEIVLVV